MSLRSSLRASLGGAIRRSSGSGRGGGTFSPLSLSTLRQYALDGGEAYHESTVGGYPVLRSLEPHGTHRPPRQGRCWLFDGVNDYGSTATKSVAITNATITAKIKTSKATSIQRVFSIQNGLTYFGLVVHEGRLTGLSSADGVTYPQDPSYPFVADGAWHHLAIVRDGAQLRFYADGVLGKTLSATSTAMVLSSRQWHIGSFGGSSEFFSGSMEDIRFFDVAKTASEILAIYNEEDDETGLLAHYPSNEESGTTGFDIGPFGNHLTLTNITQVDFHATDTAVTANRNNSDSYRLSGSVYIPKRLGSSLAADGNALTVTGQSPYPINVEVPCVTGDGSSVYCDLGSPLIPLSGDFEISVKCYFPAIDSAYDCILSQGAASLGSTGFNAWWQPEMNGNFRVSYGDATSGPMIVPPIARWTTLLVRKVGTVLYAGFDGSEVSAACLSSIASSNLLLNAYIGAAGHASARLSDLRITTGGVTTYFPLQDGPGSSNTNRNLSYIKSDGTYGVVSNAIVNGTVSTIWANRCPYVEDWCINYGGDIAANGAFLPGQISGSLAADGTAKTLSKFGNPYSRVNFNPFTAAELNGVNVEADYPNAPCVTGDGSAAYCDLGSPLIPATADFELSLWYYHATSDLSKRAILAQSSEGTFSITANELPSGSAGAGAISFYSGAFPLIAVSSGLVASAWHYITVSRVGNLFAFNVSVNGASIVSSSNTFPVTIQTVNTTILRYTSVDLRYSNGRIADLRITTGGVTTYFPLTDGSGRNLAYYKSDGTSGIVSSAIVGGTESAIWANKTLNSSPYSRQAIIPRDTKFRRTGDDRFITTSTALTGADKTKTERYVS